MDAEKLALILLGIMIQAVCDARKLIARGEVEEAARLLEVVANKVGVNVFPPILPSGERAI